MGVLASTGSVFSVGNRVLFTKSSSLSPVIAAPDLSSAAQFANNYLGNDCFVVRQAHSDGNSHLWAKVNIDGGWYNTDLSEDFGYPADPNEGATERMLYYFGDEGGISGTYSVPYAAQPLVQDWYRSLYPSTEDYDYRNNR